MAAHAREEDHPPPQPYGTSLQTPLVIETHTSSPPSKWARIKKHAIGAPGVIVGALFGALLGILLQQSKADPELIAWIALPGTLFIRALKCLVAPLVFCSLVTGMADMLNVGKASSIGWRTAVLYTITTVIAAIEGLIWVVVFRPLFKGKPGADTIQPTNLAFSCFNGKFLENVANSTTLSCTADSMRPETIFTASDVNNVFVTNTGAYTKLSLSDSLQAQLKQMVPDNITGAFANGNLLSIVMFAIPFGFVVASLPKSNEGVNRLLEVFRLLNLTFMHLIQGAIYLTPIAVLFLIAGSLATQTDLNGLVEDVGVLILTVTIGLLLHAGVFLPSLLALVIKSNPFSYLKRIIPAQVFALGCASSMATLPVTIKCVESTKQVSDCLARFVLSLGATINMDGSALYYPAAIVFMAETAGLGDKVGAVEMLLIIIVSTIGAVGSAPVPSAGIVMTITIWNSVFPTIDLPSTFSYIVATDWLLDRFITATNVTGDTVIARIIAEMVDEKTVEEQRASLAASIYQENDEFEMNDLKASASITTSPNV